MAGDGGGGSGSVAASASSGARWDAKMAPVEESASASVPLVSEADSTGSAQKAFQKTSTRRSLFEVAEVDLGESHHDSHGGHCAPLVHFFARHTTPRRIRSFLMSSSWYHSRVAVRTRAFLDGRPFGAFMVVCLLAALFIPDLCVLCEVQSSSEADVVLAGIMCIFALELVALCATDASYFLSFFMVVDLLGALSIALDVSFMLGSEASAPRIRGLAAAAGDRGSILVPRASHCARVGWKAARMSRIVRVLRFLPFGTTGSSASTGKMGIANVVAERLGNLMATRIASLTIFMVMVMPLCEILSFPEDDYSLEAWAGRISARVDDDDPEALVHELSNMARFFSRHSYGPFEACRGALSSDSEEGFLCDGLLDGWDPALPAPRRAASVVQVSAEHAMVSFSMHAPLQIDALVHMANMVLLLSLMLCAGWALSTKVYDLAVKPLDRMLLTIRSIASTVFATEGREGGEDEEEEDDHGEMALLEQVVDKLAIIASLEASSDENIRDTADLQAEDVGILDMLRGTTAKSRVATSRAAANRAYAMQSPPTVTAEDIGISQAVYDSFEFNSLDLSPTQACAAATFSILRFHPPGDGFFHTKEDESTLRNFVKAAEGMYLPNPFHNFAHAVDVVHEAARVMKLTASGFFLSDLQQYVLLVAAVGHDLGHPGFNNGFLLETSHELALRYNDNSPLENMHCAKLYSIIANRGTNVFESLSLDQYREARKSCIESILHTDMVNHQEMVKKLQMVYQMNSEIFTGQADRTEIELFNESENKTLIIQTILHSADVSNPCRSWVASEVWAHRCLDEFFAQGDREKELGIPVQFLNDRDKLNRPNSQIGFIEFMIAPFFAAQIALWPMLSDYSENLAHNIKSWEDLWLKDGCRDEEDVQKVAARVAKVQESLKIMKSPGRFSSEGGDSLMGRISLGGPRITRQRTRTETT